MTEQEKEFLSACGIRWYDDNMDDEDRVVILGGEFGEAGVNGDNDIKNI